MTPIVTITLNPTVDFATTAPNVVAGPKLRCTEPQFDPGGGGINVSRAIRQLGGTSTALIAIGGAPGAQLLQLLAFEGVATVAFQGPGTTRRSFSVIDESTGGQFRFVTPGPSWTAEDVDRALAGVDRAAGNGSGSLIVLSGSQPPGVAKDFPSILSAHIAGRKARLIVDTSGEALAHLIEEPRDAIHVLRMNVEEAEELVGHPLPAREDTADFAQGLARKGVAEFVVVARGADGSVLASADRRWHTTGAKVRVRSAIGAGDSFVGAFTLALARGDSPQEALRFGSAAASATCTTEATQLCELGIVEQLLPECVITEV